MGCTQSKPLSPLQCHRKASQVSGRLSFFFPFSTKRYTNKVYPSNGKLSIDTGTSVLALSGEHFGTAYRCSLRSVSSESLADIPNPVEPKPTILLEPNPTTKLVLQKNKAALFQQTHSHMLGITGETMNEHKPHKNECNPGADAEPALMQHSRLLHETRKQCYMNRVITELDKICFLMDGLEELKAEQSYYIRRITQLEEHKRKLLFSDHLDSTEQVQDLISEIQELEKYYNWYEIQQCTIQKEIKVRQAKAKLLQRTTNRYENKKKIVMAEGEGSLNPLEPILEETERDLEEYEQGVFPTGANQSPVATVHRSSHMYTEHAH